MTSPEESGRKPLLDLDQMRQDRLNPLQARLTTMVMQINQENQVVRVLFTEFKLMVYAYQRALEEGKYSTYTPEIIVELVGKYLEELKQKPREEMMELLQNDSELQQFLWNPSVVLAGESFRDTFRRLLRGEQLIGEETAAPASQEPPIPVPFAVSQTVAPAKEERPEVDGASMCTLFFEKTMDLFQSLNPQPNRDNIQKMFLFWSGYVNNPGFDEGVKKVIRDFFTDIVRMPTNSTLERQKRVALHFCELRKIVQPTVVTNR